MIFPVPPKSRRSRRPRKDATVKFPPGPALTVGVVFTSDPPTPGEAFWQFEGDVTLIGLPIGLRVLIDGVWIDPIDASQDDSSTLRVQYDTTESMDAKLYSIVTQPSGIMQAADIELPQEGTIHAP